MNRAVNLTVEVVGLAGGPLSITFYVCRENFDVLIIGWRSLVRCNLHSRIVDIVQIQRQLGIFGSCPTLDIDPLFKDVDGVVVENVLPEMEGLQLEAEADPMLPLIDDEDCDLRMATTKREHGSSDFVEF